MMKRKAESESYNAGDKWSMQGRDHKHEMKILRNNEMPPKMARSWQRKTI
jgi:hypothetical protein